MRSTMRKVKGPIAILSMFRSTLVAVDRRRVNKSPYSSSCAALFQILPFIISAHKTSIYAEHLSLFIKCFFYFLFNLELEKKLYFLFFANTEKTIYSRFSAFERARRWLTYSNSPTVNHDGFNDRACGISGIAFINHVAGRRTTSHQFELSLNV